MDDSSWKTHAHKNALHRAQLCIECLNTDMAQTILDEVETLIALEFLYHYAYKNYHKKRYRHAEVALRVAEKVKRGGIAPSLQKHSPIPLVTRKNPRDIFKQG